MSRFLTGERVYLRAVEETDLARAHRWINDPTVRHFLLAWRPMDLLAEKRWFEGFDRSMAPSGLRFAICLVEDDRHIGITGIEGIDWIHRSASTGTLIGETDCWGKGYATQAKALIVAFAFEEMNLERLNSSVLDGNEASARHLLRNGYQVEGRQRQARYKQGKWHDEVLYGLRRDDWLSARAAVNPS